MLYQNWQNAAGILRWTDWMGLIILNFWPRFEMKTPETLNTQHVDIFLRIPMNICVPHADKPSNDSGHWKTARCKIFDENLETHWVFEDGGRSGSRAESRQQIEWEEDALRSFLIELQAEAGMRNAGVFLTVTTSGKERLDQTGMTVRESSLMKDALEIDWRLGSLISWVFKLEFWCGVNMMIGIWIAQRSRLAFLSC
jgi:hypothetical protein